ncbi:hypothetical protein ACFQ6U_13675 [Streptomyces sp. NPDC056465]|uniref:hypothetical protein n=1 Tax=Streptomyces sp. NPDC056465 TaxID=3345829 RepID=UPI00367B0310
MAGTSPTTRSRKAAAAKTPAAEPTTEATAPAAADVQDETAGGDTTTAAAADESAAPTPAPADNTPKAPDAAPLEPPTTVEPPEAPNEPKFATPTEVIPDDENLSEVIIDDATKEPPTDPAAVFVPLTPYGSTLVCTVRLVEKTFLGPHRNPVHRLLQPQGAQVSEGVAARILQRLEAQAERLSTQAATGTDQ